MVAPKSHSSANAASANKSEADAKATELLFSAMLGLLGQDASKLLEMSIPQHLVECYEEVRALCLSAGITHPETDAAIIASKDERFKNDLLFSTLIFQPDDAEAWVAKHYPNMRPKFLGFYKNYGYVHLVNKTEGESTHVA
jgi:hypothetical protein